MSRTSESTATDADELIRYGTVASVDLGTGRCTITIDTDGASGESVTPPIRWIESRMGATRTWSPPSIGEQVVLFCPAGELGAAVAMRGMASTANPHVGDSLTELVKFSDGAILSYDPEAHQLLFALPDGATLAIEATGGITIDGAVSINGDVTVTGKVTATDDVIGGGKSLKTHLHNGVQSGSSQTGAPV